jgi:hypothetical protein
MTVECVAAVVTMTTEFVDAKGTRERARLQQRAPDSKDTLDSNGTAFAFH